MSSTIISTSSVSRGGSRHSGKNDDFSIHIWRYPILSFKESQHFVVGLGVSDPEHSESKSPVKLLNAWLCQKPGITLPNLFESLSGLSVERLDEQPSEFPERRLAVYLLNDEVTLILSPVEYLPEFPNSYNSANLILTKLASSLGSLASHLFRKPSLSVMFSYRAYFSAVENYSLLQYS